MELWVFASGSTGNCAMLSDRGSSVLIDAGISLRRIESALRQTGLSARDLLGVLITHEHSDHILGLENLVKKYALPVYAPRTVAARLRGKLPLLESLLRVIPVGEFSQLGQLRVLPFHTSHDTDESVGYRFEGSAVYAHATDSGCVTEEMLRCLSGADTVLLESNHDLQMLKDGPYPIQLKMRVLSARGHLSNADCAAAAHRLAASGTRKIVLAHLSRENNTPSKALAETGQALLNMETELFCAPVLGCLHLSIGGGPC